MGGDGSGRTPSANTIVSRIQEQIPIVGNDVFIPNYSGLQKVKLTDAPIGTGGGGEPLFIAASGSYLLNSLSGSLNYLSGSGFTGTGNYVFAGQLSGSTIKATTALEIRRTTSYPSIDLYTTAAPAQTWKLGLDGNNIFRINDATKGVYPFSIENGCPAYSVYLASGSTCRLGINKSTTPTEALDVVGNIKCSALISGSNIHCNTFSGGSVWADSFSGSTYIGLPAETDPRFMALSGSLNYLSGSGFTGTGNYVFDTATINTDQDATSGSMCRNIVISATSGGMTVNSFTQGTVLLVYV